MLELNKKAGINKKRIPSIDEIIPISWRKLIVNYDNKAISAFTLRAARKTGGLTQFELSKRTGIPQGYISEMENGKRQIEKSMAKKLGNALHVEFFSK